MWHNCLSCSLTPRDVSMICPVHFSTSTSPPHSASPTTRYSVLWGIASGGSQSPTVHIPCSVSSSYNLVPTLFFIGPSALDLKFLYLYLQPLLALKSLGVTMAIYHCNPLPQLKAFYQSALAQYCELALSFGGGEGMEESLRMCGDSSQSQLSGKSQTELQASFVECQLALARVKLQNEQVWGHHLCTKLWEKVP